MLRNFSCKTLVLAVCLVCMGALTSCIDDTFGKWLGLGEGIKIAYTIDGMTDENGNKAPASRGFTDDDGREMLQSVHIIFFDAATGKYVTFAEVPASAESNNVTFTKPQEIEPNKPYKTLIVGNGGKFVPDGFNDDFGNYIVSFSNDAAKATFEYMRKAMFLKGKPTKALFPLKGEMVDGSGSPCDFVLSTNDDGEEVINGSIRFKRIVTKLNFHNTIEKLKVEKVLVCNTRMQTPIFIDSVAENATMHYRITPFSTYTDADWITVGDDQQAQAPLYIFPNNNVRPEQGDEATTCLIIKGTYTDDGGAVTEGYWRMNLSNSLKTQALLGNHEYNIKLNKIITSGFASAYAAYQSINLIKWTELSYERDEEGVIDIEGFDPRPVTRANSAINFGESRNNGTIAKPLEVMIALSDKSLKCKVSSNFDKNVDAFLSTSATSNARTTGSNVANQTLPGFVAHNGRFYLHVFRTGPGDEPFERKIYIDAYPQSATDTEIANGSVQALERQAITVRINTSCDLEDVYLTKEKFGINSSNDPHGDVRIVLMADRNKLSKQRIVNGKFQPCYSYHSASYAIGGCPVSGNDDSYKGQIVACMCGHHLHHIYNDGARVTDDAKVQSPWYTSAVMNRWSGNTLPKWTYRRDPIVATGYGGHVPNNAKATNTPVYTCLDNNVFCSKGRYVVISDLKKKNNRYIACYIPYGRNRSVHMLYAEWNCLTECGGWSSGSRTTYEHAYGTLINCDNYIINYHEDEGIFYDMRRLWDPNDKREIYYHEESYGSIRAWRTITYPEWADNAAYTNNLIPR